MHFSVPVSFSCNNFDYADSSSRYEDSSNFFERLKGCLYDSAYEVRLASLKVLYHFLKSLQSENASRGFSTFIGPIHQWVQANLHAILLERLDIETNPKCLRRILQILFLYNSLDSLNSRSSRTSEQINFRWVDHQEVLNFWSKLATIQGTTRHAKTKETLILCFGVCIKQLSKFIKYSSVLGIPCHEVNNHVRQNFKIENSDLWNKTYECICSWRDLIKKYSDPCKSINMRNAVSEGIVASGLLEDASWIGSRISKWKHPIKVMYSRENLGESIEDNLEVRHFFAIAILDTWFTCIKLLEDEDVNLRQKLAVAIVRSMNSTPGDNSNVKNVVPTQVERVLELSFDFLTANFTHWLVYFDRLANWVLGSEDHVIFTTKSGDMVRRLFDRELDNHHEERLLISQLCCLHLQRLLNVKVLESGFQGTKTSPSTNLLEPVDWNRREEIELFIHTWRMKFLSKLVSFAKHCVAAECSMSWVGGITNHQDVFKVTYPCILGLYAFSCYPPSKEPQDSCQRNCQKELVCSLTELTKLMISLLSNPLICNLYIKMLQAYESKLVIDLGSKGLQALKVASWCQDFDPYFLLR